MELTFEQEYLPCIILKVKGNIIDGLSFKSEFGKEMVLLRQENKRKFDKS